jgi:hypothetical protein
LLADFEGWAFIYIGIYATEKEKEWTVEPSHQKRKRIE